MKIKFLLLGTSLSLIPNMTNAQCVATTDCATLGYTETSCPDGKGLKCPFGNTFVCPATEKSVCEKYGFKYTCTGTGYAGGMNQGCNSQYASCACDIGYEWKNNKCEKRPGATLGTCTGYAQNCKIGDFLNNDGTCTSDKISDKEPIGVVIAFKDNCGYAITAIPLLSKVKWSTEYVDIPSLPNVTSINDFDSCGNTQKIIQQGDSGKYPAAWATVNYAPTAAPETKGKWCLPAAGIFSEMKENLDTINRTITKINGQEISYRTADAENIWTSSETGQSIAYAFWGFAEGNFTNLLKDGQVSLRPILPF